MNFLAKNGMKFKSCTFYNESKKCFIGGLFIGLDIFQAGKKRESFFFVKDRSDVFMTNM